MWEWVEGKGKIGATFLGRGRSRNSERYKLFSSRESVKSKTEIQSRSFA
jgi:hypothetical protein